MKGNENNIKNISWNDENERNCSFFFHFYTIENVNPWKYIKESE